MFERIRGLNLFAKLFSCGLLMLFLDGIKQKFSIASGIGFFGFNEFPFFALGITVCSISLLFLLTEWVMLPYGTQIKRIKLYQGAGNLVAFAILVGGCLFESSSPRGLSGEAALALASGGLIVAVIFAWSGEMIADFCSRKKIKFDALNARRTSPLAEIVR